MDPTTITDTTATVMVVTVTAATAEEMAVAMVAAGVTVGEVTEARPLRAIREPEARRQFFSRVSLRAEGEAIQAAFWIASLLSLSKGLLAMTM